MFNNQFIFSKIKFLIFSLKKIIFLIWIEYETGDQGYPIFNGYGDEIINFNNPGWIRVLGDMLGIQGRGETISLLGPRPAPLPCLVWIAQRKQIKEMRQVVILVH